MIFSIQAVLSQASPLVLAATGGLWSECAGFLAISVEGWMIFGSFAGYAASSRLGPAGVLVAALAAGFLSWCAARFVQRVRGDPFITGLAINLAVSGLCTATAAGLFGASGVLRLDVPKIPEAAFVAAAFAGVLLSAAVLRRTPFGLRLRAAGISPEVCEERGINPDRLKAQSWALAGFFAALGGAALSFRVGVWTPGSIAGRGWLAIAAVYLGFRRARGMAAAALIFTLAERLCINIQNRGFAPAAALLGLPHILALVLYAISGRLARREEI